MIDGKRVVVVLPAYNAAKTLDRTCDEIPMDLVDEVILVDDASGDDTAKVARRRKIQTIVHDKNKGYGGNQKTCYQAALDAGADIVVMLHPDYQYTPKLLRPMIAMLASGLYEVALGSRILGNGAMQGGMPLYKYVANRVLTLVENLVIGQKLSEFHTGYRGYTKAVLLAVSFEQNSDDFVFDNQFLVQCHALGFKIGEMTCPTLYFPDASSINFARSVKYGFGCLKVGLQYRLHKWGWKQNSMFVRRQTRSQLVDRMVG